MGAVSVQEIEPLNEVRDDILTRIDALDRDFHLLPFRDLCSRIDAIRSLAMRNRMEPTRRIAGALSDALARDGRSTLVHSYLEILREAVHCDPRDTKVGDLFLAAVTVRLAG